MGECRDGRSGAAEVYLFFYRGERAICGRVLIKGEGVHDNCGWHYLLHSHGLIFTAHVGWFCNAFIVIHFCICILFIFC